MYAFLKAAFPVGLVFRLTGTVLFYKNNEQLYISNIITVYKALGCILKFYISLYLF